MAAAKSLQLWAEQVEGSSIVTTMARNGTTFGIKLAGAPEWHVTAAPPVGEALYNSGQGPETSAPRHRRQRGARAHRAWAGRPRATRRPSPRSWAARWPTPPRPPRGSGAICAGASSRFTLPALGFTGTPLGVDARKVVELGITPKVTTGILHASDGSGQVGAGVATAPLDCFVEAVLALASTIVHTRLPRETVVG